MVNPEKNFLDAHRYQPSAEDEICAQVFMTFGNDAGAAIDAVGGYLELRKRPEQPLGPLEAVTQIKNSLLARRPPAKVDWDQWRMLKFLIDQSSEPPSN